MVPVSHVLAYLFQRYTVKNQSFGHLHTALGNKIMECGFCFFLKQLGHSGNADTNMDRDYFQSKLFRQMSIHIVFNPLQKSIFSLDSAWAFLTFYSQFFRKGSLLVL